MALIQVSELISFIQIYVREPACPLMFLTQIAMKKTMYISMSLLFRYVFAIWWYPSSITHLLFLHGDSYSEVRAVRIPFARRTYELWHMRKLARVESDFEIVTTMIHEQHVH